MNTIQLFNMLILVGMVTIFCVLIYHVRKRPEQCDGTAYCFLYEVSPTAYRIYLVYDHSGISRDEICCLGSISKGLYSSNRYWTYKDSVHQGEQFSRLSLQSIIRKAERHIGLRIYIANANPYSDVCDLERVYHNELRLVADGKYVTGDSFQIRKGDFYVGLLRKWVSDNCWHITYTDDDVKSVSENTNSSDINVALKRISNCLGMQYSRDVLVMIQKGELV